MILRTAEEWSALKGVHIMDRDGWRMEDAPEWDDPIDEGEFLDRMHRCTIRRVDRLPDGVLLAELMRELLHGSEMHQMSGGHWQLTLPGGHRMYITDENMVTAVMRAQMAQNSQKKGLEDG